MTAKAEVEDSEVLGKQAAKSKRTRDKIISSVISLIRKGGFANASSAHIAKASGVSWGAVQHHFGSKDEILETVLDRCYSTFTGALQDQQFYTGTLGQRVDRFVEAAWAHYQGAEYMATMEILLATRARGSASSEVQANKIYAARHLDVWRDIFPECKVSDAHMQEAIHLVHCMLTGAVIEFVLEPNAFDATQYLHRTKQILYALLNETGADE
ncbi:MAG: TetR/AcrR family transcriptional regulator [Pseudomonadales bacterium]